MKTIEQVHKYVSSNYKKAKAKRLELIKERNSGNFLTPRQTKDLNETIEFLEMELRITLSIKQFIESEK